MSAVVTFREKIAAGQLADMVSVSPLESLVPEPSSAALRDQVADELFEHYVDRLPR